MKKNIVRVMVLLLSLIGMNVLVFGATKTIEVELNQEYKNCVFQIRWENVGQQAHVQISSPNNKEYGDVETPDRVSTSDGQILINVGKAEAGTWSVTITGEKLGKVDVMGGELPDNISVEEFNVVKNGQIYKANWKVINCKENLNIEIFADTDAQGYDGEKIGSFKSNPIGESEINLSNLDSGYYYFYMRVSDDSGIFNYAYATQALYYENLNAPEKLQNVTVNLLNGDIYLSWDGGNKNNYKILMFDALTKELINEEMTNETSYVLAMPEEEESVLVGVASFEGDRLGQYDLKEVYLAKMLEAEVIYPSESITNQTTIVAKITLNGAYEVAATLNGELLLEPSKEAGDYRIALEEGDNTIVFVIKDKEGNMKTFPKDIYLDSTAPSLSIKNDLHKVTTNKSYIYLEGYSEGGAMLYYNDVEVEMINNLFNIKCDLKIGKNTIVLVAKDLAGNESRYTAVVKRSFWSSKVMYGVIIGTVVIVLIIVYGVIFLRGLRRRKTNEKD